MISPFKDLFWRHYGGIFASASLLPPISAVYKTPLKKTIIVLSKGIFRKSMVSKMLFK